MGYPLTLIFLICLLTAGRVDAEPYLAPGDLTLRHDLQLLADAGVIKSPVTSWPLSWGDIQRQLAGDPEPTNAATRAALARVSRRAVQESGYRTARGSFRLAGSRDPRVIRTFEGTPREESEIAAGFSWTGSRGAVKLQATAVTDASDGKQVRPDDSYLGFALGNWMFAAGYQDRWWGPGWDGSLIYSSNARPVPALSVQRNNSRPFTTRWLSWLGPWTMSIFAGQLEGARVIPEAKLLGARMAFRPSGGLEIGLSRTAQWGGEGRPEDFDSLIDLLLGRDNRGDQGVTIENEPGNQLAGIDLRWLSPIGDAPYAVYFQLIGEDEAGNLPSRHIGLLGFEIWGGFGTDGDSMRLHAEYADTACNFYDSQPRFACAYNHGVYRTGYRYRGRSLAHGQDGDGRILSAALLFVDSASRSVNILARTGELNRGADPRNSLLASRADFDALGISLHLPFNRWRGTLTLGGELTRVQGSAAIDSDWETSAYVNWRADIALWE